SEPDAPAVYLSALRKPFCDGVVNVARFGSGRARRIVDRGRPNECGCRGPRSRTSLLSDGSVKNIRFALGNLRCALLVPCETGWAFRVARRETEGYLAPIRNGVFVGAWARLWWQALAERGSLWRACCKKTNGLSTLRFYPRF